MFWMIMFGFVVLIALAVVIYMLPSGPSAKARKKKARKQAGAVEPAAADTKDWKAIAERWEKQNNTLLGEIEKLKMGQKKALQDVDGRKTEAKDLIEKLALEKSWREKEQETLERARIHEKELKEQIGRTEKDLEKEHSNRLRLERDLQELKIRQEAAIEEKRQLSVKAGSQQTTLEANTKEIRELKSENARLREKREDIQWVAKSEVDELKKELARLKQNG